MRFSQNFLFLAPNRSHLPVAWYTRLRIGAIFRLWHQNWCHFDYLLTYSQWAKPFIKVFLKKPSKILLLRGNPVIAPSLTPCLKAILWTPSLIPSGKGSFLSSFQKNFRSLNPHLETVLSTYPARLSPTIPYRNFRSQKTKHFSNLFQKMFSPLYRTFSGKKRTHFFKKASCSYTASFFGRI